MATTISPMPAPEAPASIGPVGRIIGAVFSPKKTFADIARAPGRSWIIPLLIITVLGFGVSVLLNRKMDWESYIRTKAEKNSRCAQRAEEQKKLAGSRQAK